MKNNSKKIKNQKGGTIILMTFLILISILTVSMAVANIAISELRMGGAQTHSTKANFAADAGAERFLYEVIKNNFSPWGPACDPITDKYIDFTAIPVAKCDSAPHPLQLSNGSEVDVIYASTTAKIIRSEGRFQETKRNIELEFE